jgi:hypothetical protein
MADTRPIGEKLRAIDEHAREGSEVPANRPEHEEPAESRETIVGGGSAGPSSGKRPDRGGPRRGRKENGHA